MGIEEGCASRTESGSSPPGAEDWAGVGMCRPPSGGTRGQASGPSSPPPGSPKSFPREGALSDAWRSTSHLAQQIVLKVDLTLAQKKLMCDVLLSKYQGTICSCYFFFPFSTRNMYYLWNNKLSFWNKARHKQLNELTEKWWEGGYFFRCGMTTSCSRIQDSPLMYSEETP